eukprot:scaffold907_cov398-Prasinococcus_capsulatus_cf.AAC.14
MPPTQPDGSQPTAPLRRCMRHPGGRRAVSQGWELLRRRGCMAAPPLLTRPAPASPAPTISWMMCGGRAADAARRAARTRQPPAHESPGKDPAR